MKETPNKVVKARDGLNRWGEKHPVAVLLIHLGAMALSVAALVISIVKASL
jgi:hypothetical protein